jgi:hypothetical protein
MLARQLQKPLGHLWSFAFVLVLEELTGQAKRNARSPFQPAGSSLVQDEPAD